MDPSEQLGWKWESMKARGKVDALRKQHADLIEKSEGIKASLGAMSKGHVERPALLRAQRRTNKAIRNAKRLIRDQQHALGYESLGQVRAALVEARRAHSVVKMREALGLIVLRIGQAIDGQR